MTGLVTIGESMMTLTADHLGPLRHGRTMSMSMAGSESTVAIGVRRLGHPACWISRLGDDEPGALIRGRLRAEDVEVIARTGPGPTGLMLKERLRGGVSRVQYHRAGSAASALSAADGALERIRSASILHITGITLALGPGPADAVHAAMSSAAAAGIPISLDVNHRSRLWSDEDVRNALLPLLPHVAVVFASVEEARLLLPSTATDPENLAAALVAAGPACAVVTLGAAGAVVADSSGATSLPAAPAIEIDPFGAGDAFVAGFLAARLDGLDPLDAARQGATVAALAVAAEGDWEGLPERRDLLTAGPDIRR